MSEEAPSHISLSDITFRYSDTTILSQVNLDIKLNEFCLLIGPNGGGKTTLIKLLMGLLKPKFGTIAINGKPICASRRTIGYVPQSLQFDPQFPISVGEFVMLGALSSLTWYGRWPAHIKQKAEALLEKVELGSFFHSAFGSLSGGQKQRAMVMRALMDDPEILILDEPINNLDPRSSELFYDLIDKTKGTKTIVMITHFISDIVQKADTIYVVNNTISPIDKEGACPHYKDGLYHLPNTGKEES